MEIEIKDINAFKELIIKLTSEHDLKLDEISVQIDCNLNEILHDDITWFNRKQCNYYMTGFHTYTPGFIMINNINVHIISVYRLFDNNNMVIVPTNKDRINIKIKNKPAGSTTIESCKG